MVSNWTKIPPPLFKKVVIVLIDALRDDFVFGSKGDQFMPYTKQVIEKGTSYSFIAEAKPPTVTMPRIKVSGCFFPLRVVSVLKTEKVFKGGLYHMLEVGIKGTFAVLLHFVAGTCFAVVVYGIES